MLKRYESNYLDHRYEISSKMSNKTSQRYFFVYTSPHATRWFLSTYIKNKTIANIRLFLHDLKPAIFNIYPGNYRQ